MTDYHPKAIDKAIKASGRYGRKIGKRERELIHRLLGGWRHTDEVRKHLTENPKPKEET